MVIRDVDGDGESDREMSASQGRVDTVAKAFSERCIPSLVAPLAFCIAGDQHNHEVRRRAAHCRHHPLEYSARRRAQIEGSTAAE